MLSSSLNRVVARRTLTSVSSKCWASTLVISEPLVDGNATPPGTQSAVTAASQLGQAVDLLVIGDSAPSKIPEGVSKVYHVAIGDQLSESAANAIQVVASSKDCNKVVGTSSKWGSTVIPRAAALLDASPITDILQIESEGK